MSPATSQPTLLITPRFPPESCGVGDYVFHLAQSWQAGGQQVCVLTRPGASRPNSVKTLELPMNGWGDLPGLLTAIHQQRAARVQLEYSPYGWNRWGISFWLNALALRLRMAGIPFAVAFHEMPLQFLPRPDLAALAVIQRIHVWLLALSAEALMTNTAERVRILRRWFFWNPGKVSYRPNSSTIAPQAISAERRMALRREHGVPPGATVVATFGMFQSGKGYEKVIEAAMLARRSTDLRVWMLGDAAGAEPYVSKLQATAAACGLANEVWWPGRMTADEISHHLQTADIFALPQSDGHLTRSSAFMAAAAHGLAVIAIRNAANQREFTHGENVWLVEKNNTQQLATAVTHLAADAEARKRLGANLRKLYLEKFDWPQHVKVATPVGPAAVDAAALAREAAPR